MRFLKTFRTTGCALVPLRVIFCIVISSSCVAVCGKVVTNFEHLRNWEEDENHQNKFMDNFYDYYEDSFEDLMRQSVVDDEYDLDGVRFITEDDVEESYHGAENVPSIRPTTFNLDPGCPDLQISSHFQNNLCHAKFCRINEDCVHLGFAGKKSSTTNKGLRNYICCFNGCVNTCLRRNDPPKAFDWLEETKVRQLHDGRLPNATVRIELSESKSTTFIPKSFDTSENANSEKISIPGGCFITQKQLDELRLFRKYDHVETCTCVNGEVVCQVNPRIELKPPFIIPKLSN